MSAFDTSQNADRLGGRLRLLPQEQLSSDQRLLHDRLCATRIHASEASGYQAALPDGRLIGPFNALLRVPEIAEAQLAWVLAISAASIPARVREIVILTVAAERQASYVLYAHERAARAAGVPRAVVSALVAGEIPAGLDRPESLARSLTVALVRGRAVKDPLYEAVIEQFGEAETVALVALIGQYLTTAALVTAFAVPAPEQ